MTRALSIEAAAAEAPARAAILTATRTLTFADCAAAARTAPSGGARVATPSVDTLHYIHASLQNEQWMSMLHHRLPADEQARQRAAVEGAALGDAAAVLFTSGSTGAPRGVVLARAALEAAADAHARSLPWRDDDAWLLALSLAHAGGLAIAVRCLAARRPLVLLDGDFDARAAAALLERCTLASLVPTQLAALLDNDAWRPPPRLRAVLLGGAAAPPALLARAAARGVPFLTTYGMTESLGQVATAPLARAGDPDAPLVPLPNVHIEASTDADAAGAPALPAPIRIRAPMLATRYLDGAPIAPTFTTADLGTFAHGVLRITGRADDAIITGGENVHPATVEAVLAATPGVRAACVFGVADERWGQLVAAAIAPSATFDLRAALAHWRAHLPPHALPRALALAAALPVNANGKIDRRACAALPRQPLAYRDASDLTDARR